MNKVEELELRMKGFEEALQKFKQEYKNQIYELDENNFSSSFLNKIGYTEKKDGDS